MGASAQNSILMVVELLEGGMNRLAGIGVDNGCLGKIPEIHQSSDSNDKFFRSSISNNANEVSLDVMMVLSGHLFEFRNAFLEVSKASAWLKDGESEIQLITTKKLDAPFDVMVPE